MQEIAMKELADSIRSARHKSQYDRIIDENSKKRQLDERPHSIPPSGSRGYSSRRFRDERAKSPEVDFKKIRDKFENIDVEVPTLGDRKRWNEDELEELSAESPAQQMRAEFEQQQQRRRMQELLGEGRQSIQTPSHSDDVLRDILTAEGLRTGDTSRLDEYNQRMASHSDPLEQSYYPTSTTPPTPREMPTIDDIMEAADNYKLTELFG